MGFKRNRNKSNSKMVYCGENLQQYKNKLLQIGTSRNITDFIDDDRLLNKRNELISGCKHQNKLLLKNKK